MQWSRSLRLALLLSAVALCSALTTRAALAQAPTGDEIPPELRSWQGWALADSQFLRCPYVSGLDATDAAGRVCHWIGSLRVDATATGAAFHEAVRAYAPGWVILPGDGERWPQNVKLDGSAAPVVSRDGRPALWLDDDGAYDITGSIPWSRLPDGLPVPVTAGIVALSVDGRSVSDVELTNGFLRLGAPPAAATEADSLELRVHRKLTDSLPGQLDTRLTLQVAGAAREEYFGPLLPQGFVPTGLRTALPARLEADGRLRVQVRPGTWVVELNARAPAALDVIAVPAATGKQSGEIWSFAGVDRLRVAALEGAAAIDPAQANVPFEWQALPAYHVEANKELRVVERSRGMAGQDLNKLAVQRDLWRDFATAGYTFNDHVSGEMQQGWRLDMTAPYELQGARSAEQPLLVTRGAAPGSAGVEWRSQRVDLTATGRAQPAAGQLPASGWDARIASLAVTVHLPPGYRLLAALGADRSPSAWLDRWRLLDIFVVLLVVAAAFRVAGVTAAVVAGLALLLAHHEAPPLTWLYLNLLIAIAIARAVPAGRFKDWARWWRNAAFALVLVSLVPFTLTQARVAFFPQLESPMAGMFDRGAYDGQGIAKYEASVPGAGAPSPAEIQAGMQDALREEQAKAIEAQVAAGAGAATMKKPAADAPSGVVVSANVEASLAAAPPSPRRIEPAYAPGTVLQSGPGVPRWTYESHRLEWSGPVEATQSLRLVVLTPLLVSTWRLLACVLLVLLFVLLLRDSYDHPRWSVIERWLPRRRAGAPATVALAALAMSGGLLLAPASVRADTPSPEILQELKQRLLRPPPCAPACVEVATATVRVTSDTTLEIELEAHAQARAVLPLPAAARHWHVESVRIDGNDTTTLARDAAGRMIVGLERGVHSVTLRGRLASADAVRIAFPQRPARVRTDASDWTVTGIDDGRLLADSLTLTRRAAPVAEAGNAAGAVRRVNEEFPPFVHVTRSLAMGLDGWTATTTIDRVAPQQGAFTISLPLLPGESVLTANLPVKDGAISVSMPADVNSVQWNSAVAIANELVLQAPATGAWTEAWQVDPGPQWRVTFRGTPEVFADRAAERVALHRFDPRPGEKLELKIARPAPVPGASVAFESVVHTIAVGQRARDVTLAVGYRSTQGGRHEFVIPPKARLLSITADGQPLALRTENGKLVVPLQPGSHTVNVAWQTDEPPGLLTKPEPVAIGAQASNVTTRITLPESRWILFAAGGGVGPAVLYWAELVVFIVIAVLLGRFARSPLRTRDWLLVGLGLSTFSWSVLLMFAAWTFAMQWRKQWREPVPPWTFNLVQVALAVLTVVALGSLVAAIPNGLLGTPDMRITGNGSGGNLLAWFHDRTVDALPQPVVLSISIWFYKAAMLAWALWLSFALVRWVRGAWDAFTAGRIWYGNERAPAPPAASNTGSPPAST